MGGYKTMRKLIVTTITGAMLLTAGNFTVPSLDNNKAAAAPVIGANQTAEQIANQIVNIGAGLIGQATYSTVEYKTTYPYKFSCATFVDYVYKQAGVDLATYNEDYMLKLGEPVSRDQLQKGDLVFFDANRTDASPSDHVAIYYGNNKVLHMADSKQNIVITDMSSKSYYTTNYVGARRVIPSYMPSNPATQADKIVDSAYNLMEKVKIDGWSNNTAALTFTSAGFVNYLYGQNGVNLGTNTAAGQAKLGTYVAKENLKKGDLVFFSWTTGTGLPEIVGIYAGNHKVLVSNTSKGIFSRVMFVPFYQYNYVTARRVLPETPITPVEPTVPQEPVTPEDPKTPIVEHGDKIVQTAEGLTGKARYGYTYSESSLIFTGAGFTYYVFKQNGIDLKEKTAERQAQIGTPVAKNQLQKGDVIYFSLDGKATSIKHAGIYLGDNVFIHLTMSGVIKESLSSTWALQNYVTARRAL
jgi:cell wall-associated NlpC family hydrolase